MPILNYTTTIEVSKTIGEISAMLAKAKASAILTEFEQGIVSAIKTEFGLLTFRLLAKTLIVVLAAFLAGLGLESYIKDARVAKYEAFVKEDKQLIREWDSIWEKDRDVCDRIEQLSGQPPGYRYDDSDTRSYGGETYLEH
jgi:hypothetical protein